jgi:hypothetical protein
LGEHLSPADLAAREGVTVAAVYKWNYTGEGPAYFRTRGDRGPVRYRIEDVLEWERGRLAERQREVARGA